MPVFESDWITTRVKAGRNPLTARGVESLVNDGITHVLDLREPHDAVVVQPSGSVAMIAPAGALVTRYCTCPPYITCS